MSDPMYFQTDPTLRLLRQYSCKADCRVELIQQTDGSTFIRRIYRHRVPAYAVLSGHTEPSLPQIYSCREESGVFVVEEEFVDGIRLSDVLETSRPDDAQACAIIRQVCQALVVLHSHGFIHRDVKPENILLTSGGRVVLLDLDASTQSDRNKQQDTRLLGTVGYAAPEQFGFGRSDVRTDVFSVGVLLNVLCTGQHPSQHLTTGALRSVVERCIEVNTEKRYPSIEELLRHLPSTGDPVRCPDCGFVTPGGGCIHCGKAGKLRRRRSPIRFLPLTAILLAAIALFAALLHQPPAAEPAPPVMHEPLSEPLAEPEPETPQTILPEQEQEAPVTEAGTPSRPLTDSDIVPWQDCNMEHTLAPFQLDGTTYYLHPSMFDEPYPIPNSSIDSREPSRQLLFRLSFWEKLEDENTYREITDPALLAKIDALFTVGQADGPAASTLTLTVQAMDSAGMPLPERYPAILPDEDQAPCLQALRMEFCRENTGRWLITASGTVNGQSISASSRLDWVVLDLAVITPDPALEIPVVQQVNEALAQYQAGDADAVEIRLPAGTWSGYIEVPDSLSDAIVFVYGREDGTTILQGGIRDDHACCELYDLHLTGAGQDLEVWPGDSPNAGYPNIAFCGLGSGTATRCTIENFACGIAAVGRIRTASSCTFRQNGTALRLCTSINSGGNNNLQDNLFEANETALLFEHIPDHLTLSWFRFQGNRFLGNGTDIDNRTGQHLSLENNSFQQTADLSEP